MPAPLHVYRYGPAGPARVLALHGLTGHGRRWEHLANGFLPDVPVLAPDLIGHGRSSWAAPWNFDANIAALAALLELLRRPTLVPLYAGVFALHFIMTATFLSVPQALV
ncbi:MAG TPA: alpha/beta fold hydrolase, partial [Mycolicibacterium fallax]|nr:alpha/beta fold hydrolase [Mycolicibacterium fallax]